MARYEVHGYRMAPVTYEVEADSADEAERNFLSGIVVYEETASAIQVESVQLAEEQPEVRAAA